MADAQQPNSQVPPPLRLQLTSDPAAIAPARRAVEGFCTSAGLSPADCQDVGLCVNEAIANIIRHAYHGRAGEAIEIEGEVIAGGRVRLRLRDWGVGRDPSAMPCAEYDPLTPGGLGLICLKRMMDRVSFVPQPVGMLLELERSTRPEAPDDRKDECRCQPGRDAAAPSTEPSA